MMRTLKNYKNYGQAYFKKWSDFAQTHVKFACSGLYLILILNLNVYLVVNTWLHFNIFSS